MGQLEEDRDYEEEEVADYMATFFAIFYVDDAFLASRDAGFLQHALTLLVDLFRRVGLQANTIKADIGMHPRPYQDSTTFRVLPLDADGAGHSK
jgi:hypothetical protein